MQPASNSGAPMARAAPRRRHVDDPLVPGEAAACWAGRSDCGGFPWCDGRREPVVNAFTAMTLVGAGPQLEVETCAGSHAANAQFSEVCLQAVPERPHLPCSHRLFVPSSRLDGVPFARIGHPEQWRLRMFPLTYCSYVVGIITGEGAEPGRRGRAARGRAPS